MAFSTLVTINKTERTTLLEQCIHTTEKDMIIPISAFVDGREIFVELDDPTGKNEKFLLNDVIVFLHVNGYRLDLSHTDHPIKLSEGEVGVFIFSKQPNNRGYMGYKQGY